MGSHARLIFTYLPKLNARIAHCIRTHPYLSSSPTLFHFSFDCSFLPSISVNFSHFQCLTFFWLRLCLAAADECAGGAQRQRSRAVGRHRRRLRAARTGARALLKQTTAHAQACMSSLPKNFVARACIRKPLKQLCIVCACVRFCVPVVLGCMISWIGARSWRRQ